MITLESLWEELQAVYKVALSKTSYDTWIAQAKPLALDTDKNELVIELPSRVHRDYWEKSLVSKIIETSFRLVGQEINPIFLVSGEETKTEDTTAKVEESPEQQKIITQNALLNSKYTFDKFVVGKGNQMAHAAALVVAEDPGIMYNPLFFYGGVGLGKTHLMHAIGHQMLTKYPNAKIKYVNSEGFTNDLVNAIQKKEMNQFREEYRNVDLLLVDDIQFFAGKVSTQEEFFHTFNALYDNQKQIVLTSDRLPNEIPELEERLVSRFIWGLSVDITPPDLETRTAILRKRAEADQLEIPDDTLSYIAGQIDSNIRELEGALVRVQAFSAMTNADITTSLAADALKSLKSGGGGSQQLSILKIQEEVANYYHIQVKDLKGKKRVKSIVVPRQIAMYLSRELTDNSLPKIGAEFGGKDHTTVIHAHEKIIQLLKTDTALQKDIAELKNFLLH
ncbi:chromosomal replication initiator protein [Enterococcus sp. PF1-24]|uniref:chromosomal replication initiator protein DnaA n=1 Tax=unclassified Enterococcus TaxID=2608891 RepID=UPI002473DDF8|nr:MULTISPECIES: chromosomal replication initiator protein DnaA [unclassified Enterococcus]MDH6364342.1 chromosomal replication initiator protein [Enterococcus sp. PFB1-1]MDH6401469.1 chromosomal replication initiator protein [Enterococcus sp. PF1-24]